MKQTPRPCALFDLIKPNKLPKTLFLMTYTFSGEVAEQLNQLSDKGVLVRVIAHRDHEVFNPRFTMVVKDNHCKLWIIDNVAYVGSSNLVNDTILNVMVKQDKKTSAKLINFFADAIDEAEQQTYIL